MRRLRALLVAGSVTLLIATLVIGGVPRTGAQEASPIAAAAHPLVGSWVIDPDANPASDPPALAIFHADGTTVELHEREPDGVGAWQATGPRTAAVTIVYHNLNESLKLQFTVTVRGEIEVDATGAAFTAHYLAETTAPDGKVTATEEATATGTRITVEPTA